MLAYGIGTALGVCFGLGSSILTISDAEASQPPEGAGAFPRVRPATGSRSRCRLREAVEGLLRLQPGETGADAEVGAVAEGEMSRSGAGEVQTVRVGVARGVAVGGAEHDERLLPLAHADSTENEIVSGDAGGDLDGAVVAQELIDGSGAEVGMLSEPVELVGVLEQRERAVADQVRGRLMTGGEQQQAHRDDLVRLERDAAVGGMDQRAQEILARSSRAAARRSGRGTASASSPPCRSRRSLRASGRARASAQASGSPSAAVLHPRGRRRTAPRSPRAGSGRRARSSARPVRLRRAARTRCRRSRRRARGSAAPLAG